MKQKRDKVAGFTLVELMIVVAIVGILAAIALPQYQGYVVRSRWADNYAAVGGIKQAISECMQTMGFNGTPPAPCNSTLNLVNAQFLADGVVDPTLKSGFGTVDYGTTESGVFTFVGGNLTVPGCTVKLTPDAVVDAATISWSFSNDTPALCNRFITGVN